MWFSEFHVRSLADRITPKIAPAVVLAVINAVREQLPGLLMAELRDLLPGHTPKRLNSTRKDRDIAIRLRYNGTNGKALAVEFGISEKRVRQIVAVR